MKQLKDLKLFGHTWKVKYDKKTGNASFNFATRTVSIGTKFNEEEETLLHEILEVVLVHNSCRYDSAMDGGKEFLFNFTHSEFSNIVKDFYAALKGNKII